ncbi:chorismate-binding protein [Algoriphagus marinus]|uniref:chorismate-binding protein n=1 Tax=Algoriphagus marinus TaxID=1925762 RepID=UPI00094BA9F7|nr:chorismate-binding protein [Algoriphagus marinus]
MINSQVAINYTLSELLELILLHGFQSGGSFAIWRKPKSNNLELTLNENPKPERTSINLEELKPGFIVHPFADQEDQKAFFISASKYWSFKIGATISDEELPSWLAKSTEDDTSEKAIFRYSFFSENNTNKAKDAREFGVEKKHFIKLVKKGILAIKEGTLEKVVPARTKYIPLEESFDLAKSLFSMLEAYPNSFVNFFHIPTVGTWIGASPEILIETKGNYFHTMSLAGTQPAIGENPLKTAAWTQKEIEEQALVSRYIVDCFKKIRLREYEEHGPKTVLAGTLLHLRSDFKVDMKATNFPQLGSVMLQLLHPTSAVCGMPRKAAHAFLKDFEDLDRSFFAGFIGPVNIENETSIYVNLRTASLQNGYSILYAGAGVTEESDPEKEWEETELKCQIIGKFLQNHKP